MLRKIKTVRRFAVYSVLMALALMAVLAGCSSLNDAPSDTSGRYAALTPKTFQTAPAGSTSGEAEVKVKDGVQYVTSSVTGGGYEPISVQQGIPVKWTLNAPEGSLNGCNNAIAIPEYDLQIDLKTGDNLIEFTPDRSGTFAFSCWMGMIRSTITVVDEDGTVAPTEDDGTGQLPSCCG